MTETMKRLLSFLAVFFLVCSLVAQSKDSPSFEELLERAGLSIDFPKETEEIEIPFLHKVPHNKVILAKDSSYQVRYWIKPLDTWMEDYNKKSKKQQAKSMNPNDLCKSMMNLAVLDVSNNKTSGFQTSMYPELVGELYNADWEAFTIVEVGYEQVGFKYCYIWHLHKDDKADLYVYVLANKMDASLADAFADVSKLVRFE